MVQDNMIYSQGRPDMNHSIKLRHGWYNLHFDAHDAGDYHGYRDDRDHDYGQIDHNINIHLGMSSN